MKWTTKLKHCADAWRWPDEPTDERAKERAEKGRPPKGSEPPVKLPEVSGDHRDHLAKLAGVSGKAERTGSNYDN